MDAEIALEMEEERQRRQSTTSIKSSVGGAHIGSCPNSPGEVGTQPGSLYVYNFNSTDCNRQHNSSM